LKNAFAIVTLSGVLAACAVAPAPAPAPAVDPLPAPALAVQEVPAPEAPAAEAPPAADEAAAAAETARLPKVALTSALLYKLMKAELDVRNGQWQAGYIALMGAAQQTRDPRLARRAAEVALSAKQPGESVAAVRLWRELAPDSEEAAQYNMGFAVMADKLDEAEHIFAQRLRDATPSARGMAMFQIQQMLSRARDKVAAAALLERLLAPYGEMVETHVVLGQAALARGDKVRAEAEARAALAIKPDAEIAVLSLAQALPPEQVGPTLAAFIAAYPKGREARTAYARVLVEQKDYAGAREQFAALLKSSPDNVATLYAMGIMSMQLNEPAAAEGYLARYVAVLEARPDDDRDPGRVLLILSQLAEERGDLAAAQRWLDQVGADEPRTHFNAQIKKAQLMGKQGDLEGARRMLDEVPAPAPAEQAQVVLAQGQILRDAGKIEDAYQVLEKGAQRFPANPDLLYDFALLAEKAGRMDVMESALRQVMEQAPDNHHAYNALGYSLAERNVRLEEAHALIDKALKMAPGDPFIMDSMGWVQYRLGNLDAAEDYLRRAYAQRSDAEIAVHLGEVLWHKGKQADARRLWKEAHGKDPKNDTLRSTLARLHLSL
jgi:tetratricopeptide (TPR) repeat protein